MSAGAPVHLRSIHCFAFEQGTKLYFIDEYQPNDTMRYNTIRYDTILEFVLDSSAVHINFTHINAIKATESMAHLLQCSYQDCSTNFLNTVPTITIYS